MYCAEKKFAKMLIFYSFEVLFKVTGVITNRFENDLVLLEP
jgi:hypothetical protein